MANGNFTPDAGEHESMDCDLCGDEMGVTRGHTGPRSSIGALAKAFAEPGEEPKFSAYDHFTCAHREEQWHKAAAVIKRKMEKEISPTLKKIFQDDLAQILESRYYPDDVYISKFS